MTLTTRADAGAEGAIKVSVGGDAAEGNPHASWKVLQQDVLHDASPWLRLIVEHVRLPNAVEIPDFYRVDMRAYVVVFAVTDAQEVLLVEHYKHGPQQVSLELPAGYVEVGDDPLATAQRELREETGYSSSHWMPLGDYFVDGNRGCGKFFGYLAQDAQHVGDQQLESTELITLHRKPITEVFALWQQNQFQNATAMGIVGRALTELNYLKFEI